MRDLLFQIQTPAVPIAGGDMNFPVRRIYCVGRNYAAHSREMGGTGREEPFFFMKPADAVVPLGGRVRFPADTENLHHEVELVVAIGQPGAHVAPAQALDLVFGYAVGIDLTKRDRQGELKSAGHPWERAKSFDRSAPISAIVSAAAGGHPHAGRISLAVNDVERQRGDLSDLIWSVPELIARLSALWALHPGDLIFTGTPEGVGPLMFGDVAEARIEGVGGLRIEIASRGGERA